MPWLINPTQLDKFRKNQKNLVIFDATFYLPSDNKNPKEEYSEKHIPGAQFFDIDFFSDINNPVSHMLIQDEKLISEKMSQLGIKNDFKIILYDNSPLHSACRALWMFKMFGHNPFQLYILDGGLNAWLQYSEKTESGNPVITPRTYTAKYQPHYLKTLDQMKQNLNNPSEQVLDLRHPIRFVGGKEVRPAMRSGHIPGSVSFPYFTMYEADNTFKPLDKIRQQMTSIGIDLSVPIISTCGAAITAPILDFVLDLMELKNHTVYDGSWAEWGSEQLYAGESSIQERPVATCLQDIF